MKQFLARIRTRLAVFIRRFLANRRVRIGFVLANLPNAIAIPATWYLATSNPISLATLKQAMTGALPAFSMACVTAIVICFLIAVYGNILLLQGLRQAARAETKVEQVA